MFDEVLIGESKVMQLFLVIGDLRLECVDLLQSVSLVSSVLVLFPLAVLQGLQLGQVLLSLLVKVTHPFPVVVEQSLGILEGQGEHVLSVGVGDHSNVL